MVATNTQDWNTGFGPWVLPDGWVYKAFSKYTSPEALGQFGELKRLWDSKRMLGYLPDWRSFDQIGDLGKWSGWISAEDVLPGEHYNSSFRLWGAQLTRYFGYDITGRTSADNAGPIYSMFDMRISKRIVDEHLIIICWGPVDWQHGEFWDYSDWAAIAQFPLAADGEHTDTVLNLVLQLEPNQSPIPMD